MPSTLGPLGFMTSLTLASSVPSTLLETRILPDPEYNFMISKFLSDDYRIDYWMSACMLSHFSHVWLFVTPWTVACQAPLSIGFTRQEYWNGLPFPPPGDLPHPGIEPKPLCLLYWQVSSLLLKPPGKPFLKVKRRKSVTASNFPPSICHEVMGPDTMILVFFMLSFKPAFSLSSFTLIKRLFSSSSLSAITVMPSAYVVDIFPSCLHSSLWFIQPTISHDVLCI